MRYSRSVWGGVLLVLGCGSSGPTLTGGLTNVSGLPDDSNDDGDEPTGDAPLGSLTQPCVDGECLGELVCMAEVCVGEEQGGPTSEPGTSEPGTSEPGTSEPVATESNADGSTSEPGTSEPGTSEPPEGTSTSGEPGSTDVGEGSSSTTDAGGESSSTTDPPGPACGDGQVDDGEDCDDGNTVDGDACSNVCTVNKFLVKYVDKVKLTRVGGVIVESGYDKTCMGAHIGVSGTISGEKIENMYGHCIELYYVPDGQGYALMKGGFYQTEKIGGPGSGYSDNLSCPGVITGFRAYLNAGIIIGWDYYCADVTIANSQVVVGAPTHQPTEFGVWDQSGHVESHCPAGSIAIGLHGTYKYSPARIGSMGLRCAKPVL